MSTKPDSTSTPEHSRRATPPRQTPVKVDGSAAFDDDPPPAVAPEDEADFVSFAIGFDRYYGPEGWHYEADWDPHAGDAAYAAQARGEAGTTGIKPDADTEVLYRAAIMRAEERRGSTLAATARWRAEDAAEATGDTPDWETFARTMNASRYPGRPLYDV